MKAIDADVLQVREVGKPKIGDDQVLIKVAATSVNWADLWKRADFRRKVRSATSSKPNLGLECSGRIIEVGSQVTRLKIGDEVCGIVSGGGYAELVAVCDKLVIPIPMGIPLRDAAALPLSACLIWHCFFKMNRVRQDQIILIHRAAGGVGSLAIQILKYYGCHVYITAGTREKLAFCKGLGAEVCINYRKENFYERVFEETQGKGVDYILDHRGDDFLGKNLYSLAIGGTLILTRSKSECSNIKVDLGLVAAKKISITGGNSLSLSPAEHATLLNDVEKNIWPAIAQQRIRPIIYKSFKFIEAADAHTAMQKSINLGKVLLLPIFHGQKHQSWNNCSFWLEVYRHQSWNNSSFWLGVFFCVIIPLYFVWIIVAILEMDFDPN
ncbi:oxidoreductase [Abeliophyllum distichum]|uniref:Oxidoreductase n=1 Tax=Abeliophyllum distichum TaxID=126358 RepID=A0ABD1SEP6_9LAMI